ncbi:glycosyltransferase family 2 protein [Lacinutrix salivirga]
MVLVSFICILSYLILISVLIYGFDKITSFYLEEITPKTTFTVVIPFRNEAENLPDLLTSIEGLAYTKRYYNIIFVDDASEDASVEIINTFITKTEAKNISILNNKRLTNSPKKDAITTAITSAKNKWIITTDADCVLPKYWLDSFDAFIQKHNSQCIAAPVSYYKVNSVLKRFQVLDFLSLQGATIGGFGIKKPFLCNGANFAYKKSLFVAVNGFENNANIASGDDIFLLEKALKNHKHQVHYLKSKQAIVLTKPQQNWSQLVSQRKRWAAKTSSYSNGFGKFTGFIVLLANVSLVVCLTLAVLQLFSFKTLLSLFILKSSIDFLLLYKTSRFFNQVSYLKSFLLSSIMYPFFSVFVAFSSVFKSYKWKDRTFKK